MMQCEHIHSNDKNTLCYHVPGWGTLKIDRRNIDPLATTSIDNTWYIETCGTLITPDGTKYNEHVLLPIDGESPDQHQLDPNDPSRCIQCEGECQYEPKINSTICFLH